MKKLFVILFILIYSVSVVRCDAKKQSVAEIENNIKEIYCNYHNNNSKYLNLEPNEITIKFYLGQYSEAYCAIIEGDMPEVGLLDTYTIKTSYAEYTFKYIPEVISVYYNNSYYHIKDAYNEGILTDEDISVLYKNYNSNLN